MTDKELLSELPFNNSLIEKPFLEPLTDKNLLSEFPYCKSLLEEQHITNYSSAFTNYARSYTAEVSNSRDPASQLYITKPHLKNLLKDLLIKIKGFKYQITFANIFS